MEWKTFETQESNENLKNTIVKSKKYEFDTSNPLKITQYLSETSIGSKIPCTLLLVVYFLLKTKKSYFFDCV